MSIEAPITDDHGDDPETATEITLGETVEGTVHHLYDVDYFLFRAEAGQAFRVELSNGTLLYSIVSLYFEDGGEALGWSEAEDGSTASISWSADGPEQIFVVAVEGLVETGTYTLTVTLEPEG